MQISAFRGLNNVTDPLRAGLQWLAVADNVDITNEGGIHKREGYSKKFSGALTGNAYATRDEARMFIVDGGALKLMLTPTTAQALRSGIDAKPMFWAEINSDVFFNNGAQRGIIRGDNSVIDWEWPVPAAPALSAITGDLDPGLYRVRCAFVLPDGRLTGGGDISEIVIGSGEALSISGIPQASGCTTEVYICAANKTEFQLAGATTDTALNWFHSADALGESLDGDTLSPLPVGATHICAWKGAIYAAHHMPDAGQTVIYRSEPLAFHQFNLADNFFVVPGRLEMMEATDTAIVIGTAIGAGDQVHAYSADGLVELAPYGVVPGSAGCYDEQTRRTLFWTARGLCSALPFANHTEDHLSVAPGLRAGAALVRSGGRKRFLVSLHAGGTPFNAFR